MTDTQINKFICPMCQRGQPCKEKIVSEEITKHILFPLRYDEHGSGYIFDNQNNIFAQVRGYGRLIYRIENGKRIRDEENGAKLQDEIGEWIVKTLNESINLKILRQTGKCESWSLFDCLGMLIQATDILLHQKDYDGDRHEEMLIAMNKAQEYIKSLVSESSV